MKLVYGKGINDCGIGSDKKAYSVWKDMLRRCCSDELKIKRPTYKECMVCDEWLYFSNFKKWFDENYRWDLVEQGITIELDKDLFSNGNKIYSPETCIFLPQKINSFLSNKKSTNNTGYAGVGIHKDTNKYRVRIHDFYTYERKTLGLFSVLEDARNAYAKAREVECEKARIWLLGLGYNKSICDKIK